MLRAMQRHEAKEAKVIPIILRHCDWHSAPFGKLRGSPRDGKPISSWADIDEAFLDIVNDIKTALPKLNKNPIVERTVPVNMMADDRGVRGVTSGLIRSSNMGIAKKHTDKDVNDFLEISFAYFCEFFHASIKELSARHDSIEVNFRQINSDQFTIRIYRNGQEISVGKIWLGSELGKGVYFSSSLNSHNNSWNECLLVNSDHESIKFKAGLYGFSSGQEYLDKSEAAEHLWDLVMAPLKSI
jgi:hypothetical protein